MKIIKRLVTVTLSVCIFLSAMIGLITPANAADIGAITFDSKLASFKTEKYAHNSIYQNNPRLTGGYECFGFANELAIYIWGSYPTNSMSAARVNSGWSVTYGGAAVDNLCVGDIVRYWFHSIFITGIDGDTIYYCQANCPIDTNKVTYDNSIARSALRNRVSDQLTSGTAKTGWVAHYTNAATSTTTCKHEYNNKGICTLCDEAYALDVSTDTFNATTLKQINLKSSPYAAQTTVRTLKGGRAVSIVASALNHYGNKWYKTKDGDWLYSGDVTREVIAVPAKPTNLAVKTATSDTATVSWSAVSGATSYEVQYRRAGIDWRTDNDYKTKTATSYTSTGLANYSSYDYRVRAVNSAGCSDWVEFTYVKAVEEKASVPAIPANFKVTAAEGYTATVSWSAVSGATSYEVQYRRAGIDWRTDNDYKTKTATSYTSTGLANYDSYDYRVRAVNAAGCSPWAEFTYVKAVEEKVSAPAMPTNFKVTAAEGYTATVSWSAVSGATSYEVQYRRAGIDWRTDNDYKTKTATSYTSTGLANYDSYDYRVRAVNAAGSSPWVEFTYRK